MDLFGDHSVQALATMLQLALVVGSALLLVVLSAQLIRAAADRRPARVVVTPRVGLLPRRSGDDLPLSPRLATCLPARAPPLTREPLAPPGFPAARDASRLHRPGPAQPDGNSSQG